MYGAATLSGYERILVFDKIMEYAEGVAQNLQKHGPGSESWDTYRRELQHCISILQKIDQAYDGLLEWQRQHARLVLEQLADEQDRLAAEKVA